MRGVDRRTGRGVRRRRPQRRGRRALRLGGSSPRGSVRPASRFGRRPPGSIREDLGAPAGGGFRILRGRGTLHRLVRRTCWPPPGGLDARLGLCGSGGSRRRLWTGGLCRSGPAGLRRPRGASVGDELAADPSAGWEGPSDREAGAAVASAGPSPGAAGSGVVPGPGMRTAAGASGLTCFWASPDGRSACCPSPPVFAGSRSPSPATRGGTGPWPGPPPSTGGSGLGLLRASCPSLSSESDPLSTEPGPLSTCGADAVAVLVAGLPSTCGADAGSLTPGPASTSTSGRALLSEPERPCSPDWPSPLGASSATSDAGGSGGSGGSGRSGRRRPGRGWDRSFGPRMLPRVAPRTGVGPSLSGRERFREGRPQPERSHTAGSLGG